MSDADYESKLQELDRLLNDPSVPMQAGRIWALAAELSGHDQVPAVAPTAPRREFHVSPA